MTGQSLHIAMLGPIDIRLFRELQGAEHGPGAPHGNVGATPLTTLVDALIRSGTAVTALTTSNEVERVFDERLNDRARLIVVPSRADGGGRDFRRRERQALSVALHDLDIDVVHAHWTYEYALAALTYRDSPVLVSVRDWAPAIFRHNPHPYNVARVVSQLVVIARAANLTANSPYIAQRLRRLKRAPHMLPNPIAASRFNEPAPSDRLDGQPTFVAINNSFEGRKNVPTLLRSFGVVLKSVPDARLVLIGRGHEPDGAANHWARRQRLDRNVVFVGHIGSVEVDRWLRNATAFVHSSLEESFGMVLIEAMAACVPVIAGARSGAVPWVVGESGVLCDVADHHALAQAMFGIMISEELRADLARRGQENARQRFHEEAVAHTANSIYAELVGIGSDAP